MSRVFRNDYGTKLRITVKENSVVVDISGNTALTIYLKPYGKNTITKTAVLSGDGTDGKMEYVTTAGVISRTGLWQIQGEVTFAASKFRTEVGNFNVGEII